MSLFPPLLSFAAAMSLLIGSISTAHATDTASGFATSEVKNEDRTYRIWELAVGKEPAAGYPLVVLLDGNQTFHLAAEIASASGRPRLLVGIGYPEDDREAIVARRYFDLTPQTAPDFLPQTRTGDIPAVGGQVSFTALITGKILPGVFKRHGSTARRPPYSAIP